MCLDLLNVNPREQILTSGSILRISLGYNWGPFFGIPSYIYVKLFFRFLTWKVTAYRVLKNLFPFFRVWSTSLSLILPNLKFPFFTFSQLKNYSSSEFLLIKNLLVDLPVSIWKFDMRIIETLVYPLIPFKGEVHNFSNGVLLSSFQLLPTAFTCYRGLQNGSWKQFGCAMVCKRLHNTFCT